MAGTWTDRDEASLLDPSGQPRFGRFSTPLRLTSLEQARVISAGRTLPRFLADLRLKRWQHWCVVHPDVVLTFAVVDLGWMRATWVQVVDPATGEAREHAYRSPGVRATVADSLWDGHTRAEARGLTVEIHSHLDAGEHRIRIDAEARGVAPAVQAELVCEQGAIEPLEVCLPVGRGRAMFSHKVPLPVRGEIRVDGAVHHVDPATSTALLDVHKAHYPHQTWWRWATLATHLPDGRRLALNLTHNVVQDDRRFHENALWLDGRLSPLSPARFTFDRGDRTATWRVITEDGEVDLSFQPVAARAENLRAVLIESVFHQAAGRFTGTVLDGPEVLSVREAFGLCEDHRARW